MNNKRGGVGAKILLVLILMIASAVGGAYGYRVLDGKMAVRDAKKDIESVRVSDYDSVEATTVQGLIDDANKDLDTAVTRKEVYDIMEDFNEAVAKVQTRTQKELEEARKAAEEARNNSNNNNNNNSNSYNNNGNNNYDSNDSYNDYDSSTSNNNSNNSNNTNSSNKSGNSNGSGSAITNDDGTSGRSGLLGNLLGGSDD